MIKYILCLLAMPFIVFANQTPLFSIIPQGALPTTVSPTGTTGAKYTVTNNTPYSLKNLGLYYKPAGQTPIGVTQNTGTANTPSTCQNPFSLAPGGSCTLDLTLTGANLINGVAVGGPEICFSDETPSRCSIPTVENQLNVKAGVFYVYVSNADGENVDQCTIDLSSGPTQGQFTSCVDSGAGSLGDNVYGVTFQSFENQNYVYLSLFDTGITQCLVGTNGQFSGCGSVTQNTGFSTYFDTAFNSSNGQLYAYISDAQPGDSVALCTPSADGSAFADCGDSGSGTFDDGASSILFQNFNGTVYAYITVNTFAPSPVINQYTIGNNGQLSLLNSTTSLPEAATFAFINLNGSDYLYAADYQNNTVNVCTLTGTDGSEIDVCAPIDPSSPISFNHTFGLLPLTINGTQYLYVSNAGSNTVFVCTLAPPPVGISGCIDSGLGAIFNYPSFLAAQ